MVNNTELPDRKKWDRIVEEAFSSDDDHVFSEHYNIKKKIIERNIIVTKHKKIRKRITVAIVAAAVMTLLIPTTVYAYKKITARISKTANFQNTITIQSPEESQDTRQTDTKQMAAEEEKYMYYELGWLPEGYTKSDNGFKYENRQTGGGICPLFYKLPDNTNLDINLPFSIECENYETDDKTAMINYREGYGEGGDNPYGREIMISFTDTNYLLDISLTDDISKDDLIKIIDNVKLVPTEEKMYGDYIPWLDEGNKMEYIPEKISIDINNMSSIGDTISCSVGDRGYDVTVNSVELKDNFDGIHTEASGFEEDFSELKDENGNIAENIQTQIRGGDGINTIDEVVSEKIVPMHILKINATFKNTSDSVNEICIDPSLFVLKNDEPVMYWENDGKYTYKNSITEKYREQCKHFSFETDPEKKGQKNSLILEPGESADAQIAFFVDDDFKDDIYLCFYQYNSSIENFYDVRQ